MDSVLFYSVYFSQTKKTDCQCFGAYPKLAFYGQTHSLPPISRYFPLCLGQLARLVSTICLFLSFLRQVFYPPLKAPFLKIVKGVHPKRKKKEKK